ncbi:hypothetical protein JTB14_004033 [Gonioctena quinquepunctata]|nr:hypothetical protein JTB14_004033 [Gonioctena quinquepunctata]
MNFLYQVSNLYLTENASSSLASSLYSNLMVNISRKTVQRMEIDLKRTICKRCRCLLLAGITCTVRIKKKRVIWKCMKCGDSKIFETKRKNYVPWTQNKESHVDIIDYGVEEPSVKDHRKK